MLLSYCPTNLHVLSSCTSLLPRSQPVHGGLQGACETANHHATAWRKRSPTGSGQCIRFFLNRQKTSFKFASFYLALPFFWTDKQPFLSGFPLRGSCASSLPRLLRSFLPKSLLQISLFLPLLQFSLRLLLYAPPAVGSFQPLVLLWQCALRIPLFAPKYASRRREGRAGVGQGCWNFQRHNPLCGMLRPNLAR